MSLSESQNSGEVLFGDLPKKFRSACKEAVSELRKSGHLPEDFRLGIKSKVYSDYRPQECGGYIAIYSHPWGHPEKERIEEIAGADVDEGRYTQEEFEHARWAVLKGLGEVTGKCPYKSTPANPTTRVIYYRGLKCRLVKTSKVHAHAVEYLEGPQTGERDKAPITLCSDSREESVRLWDGRPQEAPARKYRKDVCVAVKTLGIASSAEGVETAEDASEEFKMGEEFPDGDAETEYFIAPRPALSN